MDGYRLFESGIGSRDIDFNESVEALGDIGNGNNSRGIGFLCGNDLPIFQDIEYCASMGWSESVYLQKFELYFCVVLEHKVNTALAVPIELLPDLIRSLLMVYPLGGVTSVAT